VHWRVYTASPGAHHQLPSIKRRSTKLTPLTTPLGIHHSRRHDQITEQTPRRHHRHNLALVLTNRVTLRQVVVTVRQPSAHVSAGGQPRVLQRDRLVLVGVVDDLHSNAAICVGKGGAVESGRGVSAGDSGADAVGTLLDEAGAEVGEGPEALCWGDDVGGGVDVDLGWVLARLLTSQHFVEIPEPHCRCY